MLRRLGKKFPTHEHPELVVGLSKADDAAVYKLNDEQALIQTLDFFAPVVDDPYQYGAISAANALNDVYAMGGDVLFALNIAAFPEEMPIEIVAEILEGGADKVKEAGGAIAGGHTIIDEEPKYGLSVTGMVHPDRILTNAEAQPGDAILLTKALGTGVLISAIQEDKVTKAIEKVVVEQMMTLNRAASDSARSSDVHAMTDVTGFGLAGHLLEVGENSGMQIEVSLGALPAIEGVRETVDVGYCTSGQSRNLEYFAPLVHTDLEFSQFDETLIYDPQTAGGLLIFVPEAEAEGLARRLSDAGVASWRIGSVGEGSDLYVLA